MMDFIWGLVIGATGMTAVLVWKSDWIVWLDQKIGRRGPTPLVK